MLHLLIKTTNFDQTASLLMRPGETVLSTGSSRQPDAGGRQHCVSSSQGHHAPRLLGGPDHLSHPPTLEDEQVRVRLHSAGPSARLRQCWSGRSSRVKPDKIFVPCRERRRAPRTSCPRSSPPWKPSGPKLWRSSPTASRQRARLSLWPMLRGC